ncbi:MAG TPA: amidohydrolase/deacetylase family metallohydrolase [Thermomicrobiales bacterium]|nr:amidohydrolase/deacetylase family metallohydrolase [Thermomicrobiales bacterium]
MAYETVINGGRVIDPATGVDGTLDVAIADGKIAAVAANIDAAGAKVIDASGQIVTPGLIDLHTHIYWGVTYWGIEPDPVAAKTGVTTWLDVGSSGGYTFPGFRRYVAEPSKVRVFALLNLSVIGLVAPTWELSNLDYCNVDLGAMMIDANRDLILGIKARIDRNTTRGTGIRPLELARELADRVGLPLMVHIGAGPPTIDEVAHLLRPGDILTHCFTGGDMKIMTDDGKINPAIKDLQERGLVLDIGHGTGSFSFQTTDAMLAQGVLPDVISSDIHQMARQGPMFDMPTTLSKFLNLGLSLPDVIDRATARPAAAMRRPDLGTLATGSLADVAIWRIDEGEFTFYDVDLNPRSGTMQIVNTLTMVGGEVLDEQPELPMHPWTKLPDKQQPILGHQPGERVK